MMEWNEMDWTVSTWSDWSGDLEERTVSYNDKIQGYGEVESGDGESDEIGIKWIDEEPATIGSWARQVEGSKSGSVNAQEVI